MKSIILLFFMFSLSLFAQSESPSVQQDSSKFTIDNCVNQFDEEGIIKTKVGYKYWFVDKDFIDGRTLKMSVVRPNSATHKPHFHEEDEFFFIIEGKAEVHLNGETKILYPYATFYCPPESVHGIKNVGDSELKYLVIKKLKQ